MPAPSIAIIGGGPCGLILARLLECKGIDYVVYERDGNVNSNRDGGSLDIHLETGQLALRQAGLFDAFQNHARYDDMALAISDQHGKKLFELGQGRENPEIDRRELRGILLDAIPKDKIKWGHALSSATSSKGDRVVLRFANGVVASGFKLVVGADGAWSKVRPLITQATPKYTGKTYLEWVIDYSHPLYEKTAGKVGAGSLISIGSGKNIIIQRQGNQSYRAYFGLQVPEILFRNGTNDLQEVEATRRLLLSDFYVDWSEEYKDLIRQATNFRAWPLYTLSADDLGWKPVHGVTLAGDAAHLAYPGGEGVNLAMTDALELASRIAEHGIEDLNRAVQEYEADMFPRTIEKILESTVMADVMYSNDPKAFLHCIGA